MTKVSKQSQPKKGERQCGHLVCELKDMTMCMWEMCELFCYLYENASKKRSSFTLVGGHCLKPALFCKTNISVAWADANSIGPLSKTQFKANQMHTQSRSILSKFTSSHILLKKVVRNCLALVFEIGWLWCDPVSEDQPLYNWRDCGQLSKIPFQCGVGISNIIMLPWDK